MLRISILLHASQDPILTPHTIRPSGVGYLVECPFTTDRDGNAVHSSAMELARRTELANLGTLPLAAPYGPSRLQHAVVQMPVYTADCRDSLTRSTRSTVRLRAPAGAVFNHSVYDDILLSAAALPIVLIRLTSLVEFMTYPWIYGATRQSINFRHISSLWILSQQTLAKDHY
jgi:hypothetical protein